VRAPAIAILLVVAVARSLVPQEPVDTFSARITKELARVNPRAASVFEQANQARDSGDLHTAEMLYRQVHQLAPGFQDATRRLCTVVMALGRRPEALSLCREAFAAQPTMNNRAALTWVLIQTGPDGPPSPEDLQEAAGNAGALVAEPEWSDFGLMTACQAAVATSNMELLRSCSARLGRVGSPDAAHYGIWLLDMAQGEYGAARVHLEQGRAAGMSPKFYATLMQETEKSEPFLQKLARPAGQTVVVWLGGLMLLLMLGLALSAATLRAVQRPQPVAVGVTPSITVRLRGVYRTVLWLCCAYYYISLPLVMLVVIGLGGGIIYAFFAAGEIPLQGVALIVAVVAVTVWATMKSIFVRAKDEDPGERLNLDSSSAVRGVLDEVAREIKTRPVDTVYVTPGTELAVMERGGMLRQLRGTRERCLILGVGVLGNLKLGAFKALLAHEYGHFSNRDTAGGGFALAVRRSLDHMAHELMEGDVATWYNPGWLFLSAFYRVFLRISQGASRLQEVLADRWAATAYGAELFEQGLRHVVERSVRFRAHVDATVKDVLDNRQPLINLYAHQPPAIAVEGDLQAAVEAAMNAQPSPYDSHPSPSQRLEWVRAIAAQPTTRVSGLDEDAWVLFGDRTALEQSMTVLVNAAIDKRFGKSRLARR
jgi:Zn-dependent protease with chaperone function